MHGFMAVTFSQIAFIYYICSDVEWKQIPSNETCAQIYKL